MCGILCEFGHPLQVKDLTKLSPELLRLLENRGPDRVGRVITSDEVLFAGFVLWHQGDELAEQPVQANNGILLFNGDIFSIDPRYRASDSHWLLSRLNDCKDEGNILELFRSIRGPYSFIYYNEKDCTLYFGRDSLGRNSLIIENEGGIIKIASLSQINPLSMKEVMELPPLGVFKMNMKKRDMLILYPWQTLREEQKSAMDEMEKLLRISLNTSNLINPEWLILLERTKISYDFYEVIRELELTSNIFAQLLERESIFSVVDQLLSLLENSVEERVTKTRKHCSECLKTIGKSALQCNSLICRHAKVGILFSGGIDCSILAILAHKFVDHLEPIDLINVAFQNVTSQGEDDLIDWNVPDRITARESHKELQRLCPTRTWNLVEVNVRRSELHEQLSDHIRHLIYPLNTVLDESLGCAFWFGARGTGTMNETLYNSKCRVVLVGSGADELFGGYTRHRNSYLRCKGDHKEKLKALENELNIDWNRIPLRNLGRDDRVIADHGRTARAPFIEENIVHFIRNLEPAQKCCFSLDQGIGDKLLLRLCGFRLGLEISSTLKKRAIQFGSRIADKKQSATDISKFMLATSFK